MLLYSYNPGSQGGKALAGALGIKRIKHVNSKFTGKNNPTVINWGASELPAWERNCLIINAPDAVKEASNKLHFFNRVKEKGSEDLLPPFTVNKKEVKEWLKNGNTVVQRTVLTGHSGKGIVMADTEADLIDAPLYVAYIPKKEEFRVHCFRDKTGKVYVEDVQRKGRRRDVPDDEVNWQIRNHQNGFIYMRENIVVPKCVRDAAMETFEATSLDFGAVDVIYNEHQNRAFVLEINTAPGLTGTTLEKYTQAFLKFF